MTWTTLATYAGIFGGAALEGEIVFVAAAVAVAAGRLSPIGVTIAGALGAAFGDQFYFYLLRGRVDRVLDRVRWVAARHDAIVRRVRRRETIMIFIIRFAPGLRIAMAAACAYARVSAFRFSVVDTVAAFTWAILLLTFVSRTGPALAQRLGISGMWAIVVPAVALAAFVWWLGHLSKDAARQPEGGV